MRERTALTKMFVSAGFKLIRQTGKHPIWGCPCGHTQITACSTIGKGCGFTNARLQIKRTLRACNQERKAAA